MINASKSYTNDTLATSPKPAAKSASFVLPHSLICKYLRILSLCISALFILLGCEKQDVESSSPSDITSSTKTVVTQESLLGDWHIFSAVIPVGSPLSVPASGGITLTADVVWQGQMMEFKRDSVRIHSHDLVYPATYPGETIDYTLISYSATYSPDGHITINGLPLALSPKKMAQSSCVATISRLKY